MIAKFNSFLTDQDPWLKPYAPDILERYEYFKIIYDRLNQDYSSLYEFANWHTELGFHYDKKTQIWTYREWAPAAHALFLAGDFNDWNPSSHPLKPSDDDFWEIKLEQFDSDTQFKVIVESALGRHYRLPLFIRRVVQDPKTLDFKAQLTANQSYTWQFEKPQVETLLIYEAHVGMAQEREGLGTYREFADQILPRIKQSGYNTIQLMAVQEHPYYGSFGYHVSNFFAVSSRFGTPEDLKYLIDKAHGLGLLVILDLVHAHAVKNFNEGINCFDGTVHQFFHTGARGEHPAWDSKLFDYAKIGVLRFLLSNIRYWLEEFRFDGFRFDGITSMLYTHHGSTNFDHYDKYFKHEIDKAAICYLQLANTLLHTIDPQAISIAEDVSGMPGLCRPVAEGGLGFDFRLGMGLPDYWTNLVAKSKDEDWDVKTMWNTLLNRRPHEKTVAYCESHDQALVGDKTLAFWLMDAAMYHFMSKKTPSLTIDRGLALLKMIRLLTLTVAGEAYLNFMGNEFGHPEWVDFPREGNNWSYKYARRQWHLADNPKLKYHYLADFDRTMLNLADHYKILSSSDLELLNLDSKNQALMFRRGILIFAFNFNPTYAIPDYEFYVPDKGLYKIILDSDSEVFGGHGRLNPDQTYRNLNQKLKIYLPNRTALIFKKIKS